MKHENVIDTIYGHQVANEIHNYYADFPSEISLEDKKLIANYTGFLIAIVIFPVTMTAISSRWIFKIVGEMMNITENSSGFHTMAGLLVVYLFYGLISGVLYWIYYKAVSKYRSVTVKDGFLKYGKGTKIALEKVFHCYTKDNKAILYIEPKFCNRNLFS